MKTPKVVKPECFYAGFDEEGSIMEKYERIEEV